MSHTITTYALAALSLALLPVIVPACDGQEYTIDEDGQLIAQLGEDDQRTDPHEAMLDCLDRLESCVYDSGAEGWEGCHEEFRVCLPPPPHHRQGGEGEVGERPEGPPPHEMGEGERPDGPPPHHADGERPDGPPPHEMGDGERPDGPPHHAPPFKQCIEPIGACLLESEIALCFDDAYVCVEEVAAEHLERACTEGLERCEAMGEEAPPHCEGLAARCEE